MSLSRKITLALSIVVVLAVAAILIGLPYAFSELTMRQMKAHAQTFGLFLRGNLESLASHEPGIFSESSQADNLRSMVIAEFGGAGHIADVTSSFAVISIELFGPDLKREVSWAPLTSWAPESEINITQTDVANGALVLRQDSDHGKILPLVQELIVPVALPGNGSWAVLVHLDFQKSMELHQDQYLVFQVAAIIIMTGILVVLMLVLLRFIRVTIVRPAARLSESLAAVGEGNLDIQIMQVGDDEFGLIGRQFNAMVEGLKERQALSQYVSRSTLQAVKKLVKTGDTFHKPERRELMVFFSDVRGFTSYSEKHDAETTIRTLNRILDIQASIIVHHGGDIDKFVGDETMATFSEPAAAFRAALTIQVAMNRLHQDLDGLRVGIGLCQGPVVQGDVGIESMKDYTVIGDTVNTAARLQALARGGEILLPQSSLDQSLVGQFRFRPKGQLRLKGKELTIPVISLAGIIGHSRINQNPPHQEKEQHESKRHNPS